MNDHLILKSFVKQLYICSIMISLSACALGDDLTVRAAKDVGRESEAMQYIRSLQLLRYYINGEEHIEQMSFDDGCYPGQIPLAGCTSSSSDLHDAIASKCNIPCANTEDLPPQSSTACSMLTCQIEQVTCAVNEILDLATTLESVSYRPNEHTEIIVPPQDFVVRAALHEQAFGAVFYSALILSQWMGTQFNHSTMYDFINAEADCAMPRSEGAPTWFEAMSISGLELIQLALEAANKAADDYVALADGIRGRHPMLETGAKDNREVRAHAAHLLAGGGDMKALFDATFDPDSDFDLTTVLEFSDYELPICTSRPLGRQARTAMALIRESGIHPTHIDALDPDNPNYISIEEFLASDSGESIRNRIAALRKLPGEVSSFNASQFASYFGLTINDFVEARIYIADENRIFRRSYEIVVDDALPSEYVGDRMRYAATVNSPSQPHWSRYAAEYSNIGLDGILSNPNIDLSGMLPIISNELVTKPNVRVFYTSIFNILSKWASYGDSDAEEGSYERGLYELALRYRRHVFPEGTAAIVLAYDEAAQVSTYSMAAAVRQSGYKYATVSSSDALECATTARIEGVLCSRADMVLELGSESGPPEINISSLDSLADVSTEYDVQYFGTHVISDKRYIYFLRSKDPNGTHDGPGDWDVISVGKVFPIEVPDSKLVLRMHVEPMIFERMGTIMSPSTRWCAKPAVHCGEAFDSRIPLEDELTDDGSIAENSWRRQLALAREAADFADALGQEARNAAVSMEEIAQGALIELQDLCGSIVSLDPLQNCNDCGNGLTPEEILSRNLVDGTVPNLMRLERCIGNAGRLDFATLGDEPICAWTIGNDNTTLCQLVEGDQTLLECPRFRSADDTEGCRSPSEDPAYRVVEIGAEPRQLLKLFSRPANYVEAPAQHSCNEIRIMREKFIQREPFLGELLRIFQPRGKVNPLWLPDALNSITSAITWSAKPGNFSTIHSGGNVLATTGDFMSGWSTTGVCASSASERARYQCDGETFDNSLFCVDRDCSIEGCEECVNSRRNLNTRLARAALLARMLPSIDTLSPHTDFVLPTVANSSQASYTSRITTINHGVFGDVVDVGRYRKQTDDTEVVKPDVMFYEYPLGSNAYGDRRTVGFELAEAIKGQPFIYPDKSPPILSFLKRINNDAFEISLLGVHGANIREPSEFIHNQGTSSVIKIMSDHILGLIISDPTKPGYEPVTSTGTFFDALELICEARQSGGRPRFGCGHAGNVSSRDLMFYVGDQLECAADEISKLGSRMIISGLPETVLDYLRELSVVGSLPADGGEYGQSIASIRQRLISMSSIPRDIESNIEALSRDIRKVAIELERTDVRDELNEIDLKSVIADRVADCALAILSVGDGAPWAIAGQVASSAIKCANTIGQVHFAMNRMELQEKLIDYDRKQLMLEVEENLVRRMEALNSLGTALLREVESLDAELSHLENIRLRARRALYRGLFLDDPEVHRAFSIEGAQRQRLNTAQARYEHARRDAIRMAFLARRAVEQRLGVELATLTNPMTLVEAPSTWEGRVCVMQGIRTRTEGSSADTDHRESSARYTDEFIGDWVRKLERFVDSYRVDYPFSDGTDTAVVSLRDDIIGSRASCEVWTGNLFAYSNQLTASGVSTSGVWSAEYCTESAPGVPELNCVSARAIDEEPSQPIDTPSAYGDPTAYSIHFGPPVDDCVPDLTNECPCNDSWCGFNQDVVYGQRMWLSSGRYQISYYARGALGDEAMVVRRTSDSVDLMPQNIYSAPKGNGFARYWYTVHIPEARDYIVGFVPPSGAWNSVLEVAGPSMVEVRPGVTDLTLEPPPFAATDANGMRHVPVCEDSSGSNFRREAWTHHCVDLCSYGFSEACNPSDSTRRCYWETEFYVSQRDIDRGNIFASSGFARGNFNYRLDSLALNFVGSAARVCSDPAFPSTCYNAGWLPFSLEHRGPYTVLNNFGDHYEASLFTGRIEQSRGLAAERYLTNPISSADFSLISQYTSTQLRGRPLTGWYVLRVWDEPGVNFEGIEDVQLVMNYRFWTRNN